MMKLPRPSLILGIALALLTLGGCERKITGANLKAVKPDMTSKEVESILGSPSRVQTVSEPPAEAIKTLRVTRYVYEQNGKQIELTFVGDRLVEGPAKGIPAISGTIDQ